MIKSVSVLLILLYSSSRSMAGETNSFDNARAVFAPMAGVVGIYDYYDQANISRNPAVMSLQSNKWEASSGMDASFGLMERTIPASIGYMGRPSAGGAWGFGIHFAYTTVEPFKAFDIMGNEGSMIEPRASVGGGVLAYQRGRYTFGLGVGGVALNYAGTHISGGTGLIFNVGTLVDFDGGNVGASFGAQVGENMAKIQDISLGGSYKVERFFKGSLNANVEYPWVGSDSAAAVPPMKTVFGVLWNAHKALDLGMGIIGLPMRDNGIALSFGLGAHLSGIKFSYSVEAPLVAGPGLAHRLGLSWAFGQERTFEEAAEEQVPVQAIAQPATAASGDKPTLAIADLDPQNVSSGDAAVIADMLRTEMVKQGIFSVIEKSNMEKVLSEQSFQQTGCTSSECAVKIGKILNARYLIVGSFGKLMGEYIISFRMVDVETANVVYSDNAKNLSTQSQVSDAVSKMATRLGKAMKLKK